MRKGKRLGTSALSASLPELTLPILLENCSKKKCHANGVQHVAISFDGSNIVTSAKTKDPKKTAFKLWNGSMDEVGGSGKGKIKNPHGNYLVRGVNFHPSDKNTFYTYGGKSVRGAKRLAVFECVQTTIPPPSRLASLGSVPF